MGGGGWVGGGRGRGGGGGGRRRGAGGCNLQGIARGGLAGGINTRHVVLMSTVGCAVLPANGASIFLMSGPQGAPGAGWTPVACRPALVWRERLCRCRAGVPCCNHCAPLRCAVQVALAMLKRSVKKRAGFSVDKVAPLDTVANSFIPALFGGCCALLAGCCGCGRCFPAVPPAPHIALRAAAVALRRYGCGRLDHAPKPPRFPLMSRSARQGRHVCAPAPQRAAVPGLWRRQELCHL